MVQSIRIYHYFRFGFYFLILLEGTKSFGVTIRKGFYWICAGYPFFPCFWDPFFCYGHSTGMMIWCQCLRTMKPASTAWCFLSRWGNHPTKDMFFCHIYPDLVARSSCFWGIPWFNCSDIMRTFGKQVIHPMARTRLQSWCPCEGIFRRLLKQ